jgi:small nuclear ribonucleoprotein (snRNP)-like protein
LDLSGGEEKYIYGNSCWDYPIHYFSVFRPDFIVGENPQEQTLIILHPKLGQMVNGIVLPIKKVFALVDSKISVEIKDEGKKLQGRLVAVDEYLNIHMDETIEFVNNERGRSLGTVVIRGNNILTIAPLI